MKASRLVLTIAVTIILRFFYWVCLTAKDKRKWSLNYQNQGCCLDGKSSGEQCDTLSFLIICYMNMEMICVEHQQIGPDNCGDVHAILRLFFWVCFNTKVCKKGNEVTQLLEQLKFIAVN